MTGTTSSQLIYFIGFYRKSLLMPVQKNPCRGINIDSAAGITNAGTCKERGAPVNKHFRPVFEIGHGFGLHHNIKCKIRSTTFALSAILQLIACSWQARLLQLGYFPLKQRRKRKLKNERV